MYHVGNILKQSPLTVKATVMTMLAALVATHVIDISAQATAVWGLALERFLDLFYVGPSTVNKAGLEQLDQAVKQ